MRRNLVTPVSFIALATVLVGCQSHQAKIDALQKQYDQISQQFGNDCSTEYLKVPPSLGPKCAFEDKKMKELWEQIQAEKSKQ
jgi:hypothetical protein